MSRHTVWIAGIALLALYGCATAPPEPEPLGQDEAPAAADEPGDSSAAPQTDPEPEAPTPNWAALAHQRLPSLELCEVPNAPEPMLCGTVVVPEDRSEPDGRQIELYVVVVPAQSETPPDDAVFVFEGGPGGAVTKRAVGSAYAGPVRSRDIVLVDQRGTGRSHPIQCEFAEEGDREPGALTEMYPSDEVRACAERLAEHADVRRYGSVDHADDIEAVRRELGYGRLNLRGGSYGTRAMMVYAQRYPESTRTLFGIGVDSPLRSNLAERGEISERALDGIAALCAEAPACAELTPDLAAAAARALARFDDGPLDLEIADPSRPDETLRLTVHRDWLAEMLRLNLYFAFTSRALPWAFHRVDSADDWEPLVQLAVLVERTFKSALSRGVALTVQCSEHMDFDAEAAIERGDRTLFGSYRLDQQLQGCAAWPHEARPPLGLDEPAVLDLPTLFLSGQWDGVTPPAYAEDARQLFPNSVHVVLDEGQHGPFDLEGSWECVHAMWAELIERGGVDGLDTSCAERMRRPPFLVDGTEFEDHVREVLVPMAG